MMPQIRRNLHLPPSLHPRAPFVTHALLQNSPRFDWEGHPVHGAASAETAIARAGTGTGSGSAIRRGRRSILEQFPTMNSTHCDSTGLGAANVRDATSV